MFYNNKIAFYTLGCKLNFSETSAIARLVEEKGYNVYRKVADEKCKLAKDWWANNQEFWEKVRNSWDEIYNRSGELTLHKSVDKKPLFMHFYELEKENETYKEV